jgi:cytidine deaminase
LSTWNTSTRRKIAQYKRLEQVFLGTNRRISDKLMTHSNTFSLTDDQRRSLIEAAAAARSRAYVPYSNYPVGAALLTTSGEVYTGCNIEIASFGATVCGERTAAFKAVSEGQRNFDAIAVVTSNGAAPCGICRQVLYEFGPEMIVIMADSNGSVTWEGPLTDLLPHGFGPKKLAEGQAAGNAD